MHNPRKMAGLVAVVGATLAFTACGGPPTERDSSNHGTLTIGVAALPTTLDPGQAYVRSAIAIDGLVSGTLTVGDPGGDGVNMGLAESVTPGDNHYIVKLKPDLKFSDASPLTASDVVASFELYLNDKTNAMASVFAPIEKVMAIDDRTVEFDLKRPFPSLPAFLTSTQTAIIPAKAIEARGKDLYVGDPLPTAGQFQVHSFGQDQITLKLNPEYAAQKPSTTEIVFKKISDPAARLAQLRGGAIDFADDLTPQQIAQLPADEVRKASPINGGALLVLNNRPDSLLSDVRIRKAIALAVDRNQINEVAYAGQSKPALGLWGTSSEHYKAFLPPSPDVQAAKDLLNGTKCANGCTLGLSASSDIDTQVNTALVVQNNLKAIGIDVTISKAEESTVLQQASDGNFQMMVSFSFDNLPDTYLQFLLGPDFNAFFSGYSSPQTNHLIEEVNETSGEARAAAAGQINTQFANDLPLIPLVDVVVTSASRVPSSDFYIDHWFKYHVQ